MDAEVGATPAKDIEIVKQLAEVKIQSYNPEKKEGEEDELQGEQMGWFTMVLRYADGKDLALLASGLFGSLAFGVCLPGFCYFFGRMIDETA